jgi:hypothetical protein
VTRLIDMRGDGRIQEGMFSYVSLQQRVPKDHPLRAVRKLTDTVLRTLGPELDALYADSGRPSIAPEYILRALLLQVFYSVGADKAYDSKDFVRTVRELNVAPHVTKNDKGRRSNLDRRTTRQPGYAVSLSRRWLIEKGFGWLKQTGPLRQVKLRGLEKVDWLFVFSCAAHNLIRLPKLMAQPPERLREQCA